MNLIDISCPAGGLTEQDRQWLAAEIVSGLVGSDEIGEAGVPEDTMRRARRMTHVGFRELTDWTTGDGPWQPGSAPPLWVTATVPEEWREELSRHLFGWVRRAVKRLDQRHGWQRDGGSLWINLVGIADGSIGLNGKPTTADDVVLFMTEEFRSRLDAGLKLPEGIVVDPICGMQVRLGPRAITLEQGDEVVGFCAKSCRDAYARRHAIPIPD